ncbi:hypothetical protein FRC00_000682 [Tulasnella sp. 408]|nr:hypothetical protein FRC00_000682 [Tulasnella sp. 408]
MSRNTKTKKRDTRKHLESKLRPIDEWKAELATQVETGPFNNFTTTSFDTAKLRNDELQRRLYRDKFVLGKAADVEEWALAWLDECMCLHKSSGTAKQPSSLRE